MPALKRLTLLALAATLTGCALAPGTNFAKFNATPNPLVRLLGDEPEEAPVPPGALTRITPQLVRQLREAPRPDPAAELQPFFGTAAPYRIGPLDVVGITVWGYPEFSSGGSSGGASATSGAPSNVGASASSGVPYNVGADGHIQFPYVGLVKAAGLTDTELRELLTSRLSQLLKNPQVTVAIQAFRSGRIYVDGEVRTPGQQAINDLPMTLPEAIGRAGGLTPAADRSRVLITRGVKTVSVNLEQLTARGIDPNRILLAAGDTVRVANFEDEKVYVLGEVGSPGGKPLKKGRLTLHQALGEALGVSPYSGDPRQVFVIRVADPAKPEIYHLDVSNPLALALAEGFDLRDRDVVYVDPVPLVRWNRVISLVLPSAQAITVSRDALRLTN